MADSDLAFLHSSMSRSIHRIGDRIYNLVTAIDVWKMLDPNQHDLLELTTTVNAVLGQLPILTSKIRASNSEIREQVETLAAGQMHKRQEPTSTFSTSIDPAAPTFIPPPKTDITDELINQSLTVEPENTGTITGVMPDLMNGVLVMPLQLRGIAPIVSLNCSTSFPCGAIGKGPDPNILIVPETVVDGVRHLQRRRAAVLVTCSPTVACCGSRCRPRPSRTSPSASRSARLALGSRAPVRGS